MTPAEIFADAPCIGLYELFDSDNRNAHIAARALCDRCPVTRECAAVLATARAENLPVGGTWAGKSVGRKELVEVTLRCLECRTEFGTTSAVSRYCSGSCRSKADRARRKARREAA